MSVHENVFPTHSFCLFCFFCRFFLSIVVNREDHTKSYSCIIGCEVSSLERIPDGLVGKSIPASKYAVYSSQGSFPEGLVAVWQTIWNSELPRSYTVDFELYEPQFHPLENPEVQVYIAIDK
jgi:predicted transcriptional regulator YdeE